MADIVTCFSPYSASVRVERGFNTVTIFCRTIISVAEGIQYRFCGPQQGLHKMACCCSMMRATMSYIYPHLVTADAISLCCGRIRRLLFNTKITGSFPTAMEEFHQDMALG